MSQQRGACSKSQSTVRAWRGERRAIHSAHVSDESATGSRQISSQRVPLFATRLIRNKRSTKTDPRKVSGKTSHAPRETQCVHSADRSESRQSKMERYLSFPSFHGKTTPPRTLGKVPNAIKCYDQTMEANLEHSFIVNPE